MASWIRAQGPLKRLTEKPVTAFYDTSLSPPSGLASLFLEYVAAYIYALRFGSNFHLWDPSGMITLCMRYHPSLRILKQKPSIEPFSRSSCIETTKGMKFSEIKKFSSGLLEYNPQFLQTVSQTIQLGSANINYDICIHMTNKPAQKYFDMLVSYETKLDKKSLFVYVACESSEQFTELQALAKPSWRLVTLNKKPATDPVDAFVRMMAEVNLMAAIPAMILDFANPIGRLIFLMQSTGRRLEYFKEVNRKEWFLLE